MKLKIRTQAALSAATLLISLGGSLVTHAASGIHPLSDAERTRAIDLVNAEVERQALIQPGARTELLHATVVAGGKKQRASQRRARVLIYDYDTNTLVVGRVDLKADQVRKVRLFKDRQPSLNPAEVDNAKQIALANDRVMSRLGREYFQIKGTPLANTDDIVVHVRGFNPELATQRINADSRRCTRHRCARVSFMTDGSTLFRFVPIVDLSTGKVVQNIPFGPPNRASRAIREDAERNRDRRNRVRQGGQ